MKNFLKRIIVSSIFLTVGDNYTAAAAAAAVHKQKIGDKRAIDRYGSQMIWDGQKYIPLRPGLLFSDGKFTNRYNDVQQARIGSVITGFGTKSYIWLGPKDQAQPKKLSGWQLFTEQTKQLAIDLCKIEQLHHREKLIRSAKELDITIIDKGFEEPLYALHDKREVKLSDCFIFFPKGKIYDPELKCFRLTNHTEIITTSNTRMQYIDPEWLVLEELKDGEWHANTQVNERLRNVVIRQGPIEQIVVVEIRKVDDNPGACLQGKKDGTWVDLNKDVIFSGGLVYKHSERNFRTASSGEEFETIINGKLIRVRWNENENVWHQVEDQQQLKMLVPFGLTAAGVMLPLTARFFAPTFYSQVGNILSAHIVPVVGIGLVGAAVAAYPLHSLCDQGRNNLKWAMGCAALMGAGTACAFFAQPDASSAALTALIGAGTATAMVRFGASINQWALARRSQ